MSTAGSGTGVNMPARRCAAATICSASMPCSENELDARALATLAQISQPLSSARQTVELPNSASSFSIVFARAAPSGLETMIGTA